MDMEDLMSTAACTLPTADRPLRLAEFDELFTESVRRVDRDGDSVRLHLSGASGLRETVRGLAERESSCCSFFTFIIDGHDDDLTLEIAVPADHREILHGLVHRAEELSA
jgi:hypothetical protein